MRATTGLTSALGRRLAARPLPVRVPRCRANDQRTSHEPTGRHRRRLTTRSPGHGPLTTRTWTRTRPALPSPTSWRAAPGNASRRPKTTGSASSFGFARDVSAVRRRDGGRSASKRRASDSSEPLARPRWSSRHPLPARSDTGIPSVRIRVEYASGDGPPRARRLVRTVAPTTTLTTPLGSRERYFRQTTLMFPSLSRVENASSGVAVRIRSDMRAVSGRPSRRDRTAWAAMSAGRREAVAHPPGITSWCRSTHLHGFTGAHLVVGRTRIFKVATGLSHTWDPTSSSMATAPTTT